MATGLKFSPKGHRYTLDGRKVTGVTTLLGQSIPKPALPYWAGKTVAEFVAENEHTITELRALGDGPLIAALAAIPNQKRDDAGIRGTDVHADAAAILDGRPEDAIRLPHARDYVLSLEEWLRDANPTPVLIEFACASRRHWYAGTGDAVMDFPPETVAQWPAEVAAVLGTRVLVDWKTSSKVFWETAYQIAGYRYAEFYVDENGDEQPMADLGITGAATVHITSAGCDMYPMVAGPEEFETFTHLAYCAKKLQQSERLKMAAIPTLKRRTE